MKTPGFEPGMPALNSIKQVSFLLDYVFVGEPERVSIDDFRWKTKERGKRPLPLINPCSKLGKD